MIFTFTDFGPAGPYLAQMEAAILSHAPNLRVLHLLSDAPRFDPRRAGYLLAALLRALPASAIVVAVVDPGVGGDRLPLMVEADDRVLIGPDNGLLLPSLRQAERVRPCRIDWQPGPMSASFHGRDLFAPVAAMTALGRDFSRTPLAVDDLVGVNQPADLAEIIYFDHYGNAFTGIRGTELDDTIRLSVHGREAAYAPTFSMAADDIFWYRNSSGLIEIAASNGSARDLLGLEIGVPVGLAGGRRPA